LVHITDVTLKLTKKKKHHLLSQTLSVLSLYTGHIRWTWCWGWETRTVTWA